MTFETVDRATDAAVAKADKIKIQTADALEEAARRLRNVDIDAKGEDVRNILHDVESRMTQFKDEIGAGYQKLEADYHKRVEPVEHVIADHPIPAVLVAAGVGFLLGMLMSRIRD